KTHGRFLRPLQWRAEERLGPLNHIRILAIPRLVAEHVAVLAALAYLVATVPRVPGCVRPLNGGGSCHLPTPRLSRPFPMRPRTKALVCVLPAGDDRAAALEFARDVRVALGNGDATVAVCHAALRSVRLAVGTGPKLGPKLSVRW